jgi:hypothetical protein
MVVVDYGNTPIKDLKEKKIAGLERYRAVWKKEVLPTTQRNSIMVGDWNGLRERLPSLAPDIITAIINGKNPPQLTAKKLMRLIPQIPVDWAEQRKLLGFQQG